MDDKINLIQMLGQLMDGHILRKEEIACDEHFLLFQHVLNSLRGSFCSGKTA